MSEFAILLPLSCLIPRFSEEFPFFFFGCYMEKLYFCCGKVNE